MKFSHCVFFLATAHASSIVSLCTEWQFRCVGSQQRKLQVKEVVMVGVAKEDGVTLAAMGASELYIPG